MGRAEDESEEDQGAVELRQTIGVNIRAARQRHGLSQVRFAELAGLRQAHLSQIESGQSNVSIGTLQRIAAALGTEVSVLAGSPAWDTATLGDLAKAVAAVRQRRGEALLSLDVLSDIMKECHALVTAKSASKARRR